MKDNSDPKPACLECGTTDKVDMYNSREVRYGFLWLRKKTVRLPGFLCVPCWMSVNPTLFPPKVKEAINVAR